jgi:antitoxin CcdA
MSAGRKATNVSLDADLIAEARDLDINISRAAELGLSDAVRKEKERRWKEDNATAFDCANAYVEKNGIPLSKYRRF